ncbi:MAG: hypothetical protein ABJP45_00855 [Cyclobacteriaceae bacterium]
MKRILFLFLISGVVGCNSEIEIPLKVSKNFWYKYENATQTEWILESDIYTVTFTLNNFPKTSSYKKNGEWINTISPLPPRRSMICVRDFVDERYATLRIKEVVFVETATSEKYFVTLGGLAEDEDQGSESVVLEFNADCEFVRVGN